MSEEATTRPPWRPTKYKPEFCEQVIEYGRQGKSRTWIAAQLGVVPVTLSNWESDFPDFLCAMEYALVLSQQWWEDSGQTGMTADKFNNGVWSRSMSARFPREWREKQDIELNGKLQVTEIKRTIVDPRDSDA